MSLARFWSNIKLLHFSKPAGDRPLYRAVRGKRISSVLEVNIGNAARSERLIGWIRQHQSADDPIRYAAIDAFEMGGEGHLTLKSCHSRLGKLGVKPLPVPIAGGLSTALTRVAHTIGAVDLLILDCDSAELQEARVQAILPRLHHAGSIILGRTETTPGLTLITLPGYATQPVRQAA